MREGRYQNRAIGTRHSAASVAASAGAPIQAIQAVLDHTDIRTTMKYAMVELSSQAIVFESANKKILQLVKINKETDSH